MSDLAGSTGAAVRAADALLRTSGRVVKLRVPAPAAPGDDGEQLGLATPQFQDMEVAPAVFRKARVTAGVGEAARYELIVSASALQAMVGSLGYESVAVLFQGIAGVLVGERLLFVDSCRASETNGEVYCYRIGVRGPVGLIV